MRTCVHHGEESLVDEGYYRCLCPGQGPLMCRQDPGAEHQHCFVQRATPKNADQHRLVATGREVAQIVDEIVNEVARAERKFPGWPDDLIHGAAIMAEESGEAVRACLQVVYQDGDPEAYRQELVQTAAMCLRALVDLRRRPQ